MNAALENLISDLPELRPFIVALNAEADAGNPHCASLRGALIWVEQRAERDGRSVAEKIAAIEKLCGPPRGFVHIPSISAFLGWDEVPRPARSMQ